MGVVQIVAIGIVVCILTISIKKPSPEFSLIISIAGSVIIFFMILPQLASVIGMVTEMSKKVNTNMEYVSIVLKVIGIAYLAEFGSQICVDAGESSIASKIEIAGKILIMVVSAPILFSLLDLILYTLP